MHCEDSKKAKNQQRIKKTSQKKHFEDNEQSRCSSIFDEPSFAELYSDDEIVNLPLPDE